MGFFVSWSAFSESDVNQETKIIKIGKMLVNQFIHATRRVIVLAVVLQ